MILHSIFIPIIAAFLTWFTAPSEKPFFQESVLWPVDVDKNVHVQWHFVYGLAETENGNILCFSEGRIGRSDDQPHHIILKRSLDQGKTWLPSQVLVESLDGESFANPTPVVEKESGNVFLFYAQNFHNEYSELYYLKSEDQGETWSKPTALTSLFSNDPIQRPFHLPGPGHGIQLRNGRLLLQVWHRFEVSKPLKERGYGVSVLYSDDQGETWKSGGFVPQDANFPANESRLAELPNGKVLLEARYANSGVHHRIHYFSEDGGEVWSKPSFGKLPAFTAVDAGITTVDYKNKDYLLAVRPIDTLSRKNLAVSVSMDQGETWPITKMIHEGPADYSDIITLADKSFFVLYGRGNPKHGATAHFNMEWLLQK